MGAEGWVQEETAVLWPPSGDVSVQERVLLYALDGPDSDGSGLPETEWKFTVGGEELFCRPLYPASPEGEAAEEEAVASILFGNGTTAPTTTATTITSTRPRPWCPRIPSNPSARKSFSR